ncbi:MAG: RNA-directed DNA polymerase [Clostridium sp.]|nr:RNA-directed DNA polymerase [Clostridium sp.]
MTEFEKVHDFTNLYAAYRKSRRGKREKDSVAKFEAGLLEQIGILAEQLENRTYKMSPYHSFMVYEPKKRVVMANSFRDKVVQHSLCDNALEPIMQRSFILDNYAVQVDKGTHFGLDRLREFMRSYFFSRKAAADEQRLAAGLAPLPTERGNYAEGWVLKCDVGRYFYSIPHASLKEMVRRHISDEGILWLVDIIIDSTDDPGIPIGNQTSQWFAIAYLNGLDHYVKERLGIRYYGRYMDDFFLIHESKEYLRRCRDEIIRYAGKLGLTLNSKTNIFPLRNGIDFLGFHTYLTETGKVIRKVRKASKERAKRKLRGQKKALDRGETTLRHIEDSYQAWRNHASHGNSYNIMRKTDAKFRKLFKESEKAWHKT